MQCHHPVQQSQMRKVWRSMNQLMTWSNLEREGHANVIEKHLVVAVQVHGWAIP